MPFSVACSQQQNYYSHDKGRLSIQLKGHQPLLCKSRIQAPTGALGIRLFIRLFKIRLNSPNMNHIFSERLWYPLYNIQYNQDTIIIRFW